MKMPRLLTDILRRSITPKSGVKTRAKRLNMGLSARLRGARLAETSRRRQKSTALANQPKNIRRHKPVHAPLGDAKADQQRSDRARQFAGRHEKAHAAAEFVTGDMGDHRGGGGMEGDDADADAEEQQSSQAVGGHEADERGEAGGDGGGEDDEVTHAEAVGQETNDGTEQGGRLHEDWEGAGEKEREAEFVDEQGEKGCDEGGVDIVDEVTPADEQDAGVLEGG